MVSLSVQTQVLIAVTYPFLAEGIKYFLEKDYSTKIADGSLSWHAASQHIVENKPDIVVLDLDLPGLSNLDLRCWLAGDAPSPQVIVLGQDEEWSGIKQALENGARGFVLKRSSPSVLLQAVRAALDGGVYIDPAVARHLVPMFQPDARRVGAKENFTPNLTEREREVFQQVALGFTNKEIAGKLGITSKSVETYRMRGVEKLNLRSRAKIVQYALSQGWLTA